MAYGRFGAYNDDAVSIVGLELFTITYVLHFSSNSGFAQLIIVILKQTESS